MLTLCCRITTEYNIIPFLCSCTQNTPMSFCAPLRMSKLTLTIRYLINTRPKKGLVKINPQRKEVPIMQAPENNKITYKYVYKYGNHTEHLGNAQMDKPETNEDYGKPGSSHDIISVILSIWFILPAIITEIVIQSSFRGGIIITLTIIGAVTYSYFTHHWKTQPSNHPVKTQTSVRITLA